MKILFITNVLPPIVDGVGDYTYNLAHEFAKHGHETHIICTNKEEIRDDYEDITVAKIVKKWNFQVETDIASYIRLHDIDVVSLQYVPHGFHPKGLPLGLISIVNKIKKTGVKLMIFCHEVSVEYTRGTLKQKLLEFLMKDITKRILSQADVVATSISYYRQMILRSGISNPVSIIPIASNVPEHEYKPEELLELKQAIAPEGEFIVAFFGKRNIVNSCIAINELVTEGYHIRTLFIGNVNIEDKYKPQNSHETGVLDINELHRFFLISDALILPEQLPYGCSFKSGSLIASMRAGLPVISTKGYMTDNEFYDRENILFADFSSIPEIKRNILCLLQDEALRAEIAKNACALVSQKSWECIYTNYAKILHV